MNKGKYITVTKGNIHLVAFRIKKFIERMEVIGMQSFYLDTQKRVKQFGKDSFDVTQSSVGYLSNRDYILEVVRDYRGIVGKDKPLTFIRVNYQQSTCGFLIGTGEKIRITPTHIFIHAQRIHRKGSAYPYEVWQRGDESRRIRQTDRNVREDTQYWKDYEEEQMRELNEGEGFKLEEPMGFND